MFIGSFDSALEMIADGTWDSGESLTVRLSDESLDKDTMTDEEMSLGDVLPVLMVGTPITLGTDAINDRLLCMITVQLVMTADD